MHNFLNHALLLSDSYRRWTGDELVEKQALSALAEESQEVINSDAPVDLNQLLNGLNRAQFALVSHGTEPNPVFNYGNLQALKLFAMDIESFIQLPSKQSAEVDHQNERASLFERVAEEGFITDYQGVRISSTGKRFYIKQAVVWTVVDDLGREYGHAAKFSDWEMC